MHIECMYLRYGDVVFVDSVPFLQFQLFRAIACHCGSHFLQVANRIVGLTFDTNLLTYAA